MRKAGTEHYVPGGLLARAGYHRYCIAFCIQPDAASPSADLLTQAQHDLQESHDIAQRGGMRLHLTDYYLECARLALSVDQPLFELTAAEHVAKAKQLIEDTGYKRRLPEVVYLEACLAVEE